MLSIQTRTRILCTLIAVAILYGIAQGLPVALGATADVLLAD